MNKFQGKDGTAQSALSIVQSESRFRMNIFEWVLGTEGLGAC